MANKDKYDLAIEILKKDPTMITEAWSNPEHHEAGCLFMWACKSMGCLTLIRKYQEFSSQFPQVAEIAKDERIPTRPNQITIESLPVFAEWQRRLDKELGEDRNA
jgi:hypothetical protein